MLWGGERAAGWKSTRERVGRSRSRCAQGALCACEVVTPYHLAGGPSRLVPCCAARCDQADDERDGMKMLSM